MLKEPPITCYPSEGSEPWEYVCGIYGGRLDLKHTRRGVDLLYHGRLEDLHTSPNFQTLINTMRGWRAVQGYRSVARYDYDLIDNGRHEWFCASLAPGRYYIRRRINCEELWWCDDEGTAATSKPQLAPE